jgi:hypothetical protein
VVVVLRRNLPVVRQRRFDAATLRSVLCDLVVVAPRPQRAVQARSGPVDAAPRSKG